MNHPTTRKEALKTGATHYYTGIPCKRGHKALRATRGSCMECRKNEWQLANEKRKLLPKSEAAKEAGRRYYEKNKEDVKARATARPAIERNRARKAHRLANPEYYKALVSFRRKKHQQATPKWLTYIQKKEIRSLYIVAQTSTRITGVKYVVDHIVPLINNNVCGLHVPWNLQIMTQEDNLLKSNKHNS